MGARRFCKIHEGFMSKTDEFMRSSTAGELEKAFEGGQESFLEG